ncbi:CLUMA_CG008058, isoform A [Clunio marinus]|uniref:CLUMA_CG008058, isoform A n=1 Tax=Clunio marinus TaxID=568069 RepID=A0A1J1I4N3_9DIPT|nr:CLUMA_CG008058, isoform A [Clunio marinus]
MFKKRYFIWFTVFIYIVLLFITVFIPHQDDRIDNSCTNDICIRFCCKNSVTCNDEFIRSNFNASFIPKFDDYDDNENDTRSFRILYEMPSCDNLIPIEQWEISKYDGIKTGDEHIYEDYCFEDTKVGDEIRWKVLSCSKAKSFFKMETNLILRIISEMTFLAVLLIYVYLNKWKTLDGRIVIMFVSSLASEFFFRQIVFYDDTNNKIMEVITFLMEVASIVSTLLWMSVMIFDIWLNFKNLDSATDGMKRFKFYCAYVFSIIVLQITSLSEAYIFYYRRWLKQLVRVIIDILLFTYLVTICLEIIFLVGTAVKIFLISKATNHVGHAKFEDEKKRFWMCLSAFGIIVMIPFTNIFPLLSPYERNKFLNEITNCFSAFVLFFIFILMDKNIRQRLFHKRSINHERLSSTASSI